VGADFVAPGPGEWQLDRSHFVGGVTPIAQSMMISGMADGFRRVFAELGVPADTVETRFVNDFHYTRLRPLIGADRPSRRPPPAALIWVVSRIHPKFRACAATATVNWANSPAGEVARRWHDEIKPSVRATNLALQTVDPGALADDELQAHVDQLIDHVRENIELHFWLHGHDLGPIARFLYETNSWGIPPDDAVDALAGASPSTAAPLARLVRLRALVDAAPGPITTLDDVRAISDEASALVDEHLDEHGWVLATGYDLTSATLVELPDVMLATIRSASPPPEHDAAATATRLRARVPVEHRDSFDRLLADARDVMDMRDDQGPITYEWPAGLLRRALLAAGDRLHIGELALELTVPEAHALFAGRTPSIDALTARADRRRHHAALTPPATLGDPEPQPPLDALPESLARMVATVQFALEHTGMAGPTTRDPLSGTGVGTVAYTGRAVVADSAHDAMDRLEPGDVLVVRATSPAFNLVLSIAGAVVTVDGGAMSHAAVLSRELGLPAVIGASGALSIVDGSRVEVDPVAGVVRCLTPSIADT
jgi:pyruvate,water dikinase